MLRHSYTDTHPLVHHVAKNSLRWGDEEKFTFIWDNHLVVAHYDRLAHKVYILTDVGEKKLEAIHAWLAAEIQPFSPEMLENEEN